MMNFGQGNQILGGDANSALNEAIARRQQGQGGATGSVSPASPTFNPSIQQPQVNPSAKQNPVPNPVGGGASGSPPFSSSPNGVGMGLQTGTPEAELIIKALSSRLKILPV